MGVPVITLVAPDDITPANPTLGAVPSKVSVPHWMISFSTGFYGSSLNMLTATYISYPFATYFFNLSDIDSIQKTFEKMDEVVNKMPTDIQAKIKDDYSLLKQQVRLLANMSNTPEKVDVTENVGFVCTRLENGDVVLESKKEKAGKKKTIYTNGKRKVIITRKKYNPSSAAQKAAALNASRFAHTPAADKKRRKSMMARRDDRVIAKAMGSKA